MAFEVVPCLFADGFCVPFVKCFEVHSCVENVCVRRVEDLCRCEWLASHVSKIDSVLDLVDERFKGGGSIPGCIELVDIVCELLWVDWAVICAEVENEIQGASVSKTDNILFDSAELVLVYTLENVLFEGKIRGPCHVVQLEIGFVVTSNICSLRSGSTCWDVRFCSWVLGYREGGVTVHGVVLCCSNEA